MRWGYTRLFRYRITHPPKALRTAKLDNIAIVPASLLPLKARWQAQANTLPERGVLLYHSQKNTRQRKVLASVAAVLKEHGHPVMNLPLEQMRLREPAYGGRHRTMVHLSHDAICLRCDRMTQFLFSLSSEMAKKSRGSVAVLAVMLTITKLRQSL
jgi:hypothetical protein